VCNGEGKGVVEEQEDAGGAVAWRVHHAFSLEHLPRRWRMAFSTWAFSTQVAPRLLWKFTEPGANTDGPPPELPPLAATRRTSTPPRRLHC
jgi:hypothetical protein